MGLNRLCIPVAGLVLVLLLNCCTKTEPVAINRLDEQLFAQKTPDAIQKTLAQNPALTQLYFGGTSPDSLANDLARRLNDPELNLLHQQAQTEFGDLTDLRADLGTGFANIQKAYPDFKPPRVVTMFTGFLGPDLVVTDSLIVIGLDWFIGPGAKYRPQGAAYPDYILRRYSKPFIAPAIITAMSIAYNADNKQDQTMLAEMVYYGKSYVFTKTMLPNAPDSTITGYTTRQLTDTENAQDLVWAHFIDKQLLYQTAPDQKTRYLNERPFTAEIGPRCPGAIGRWVGWRIVNRYFDERTSKNITELMRTSNARQIFEQSGYKGQRE
jgi:hypothetical protein